MKYVAVDLSPLSTNPTLPPPDYYLSAFVIDRVALDIKLSRINIHQASSPDGLPNWVLRDFCDKLPGPVCAICSAVVREGFVPPC